MVSNLEDEDGGGGSVAMFRYSQREFNGLLTPEPSDIDADKRNEFQQQSDTEMDENAMTDSDDDFVDSDSDYESGANEDSSSHSLAHSILSELAKGLYICLVCTCEIDSYSKIWSCKSCYRVYDLDCIRDWALRGSSTDENNHWRCPSCNVSTKEIPSVFTCWCGKYVDPEPNVLTPFSCGNSCDDKYDDCIHKCSSPCHPGKHPICSALGPVLSCHCGKEHKQVPCVITPYETGWACEHPCEESVCDHEDHSCPQGDCHSGLCGECTHLTHTRCYCGQEEKHVECSSIVPAKSVQKEDVWIGGYQCDNEVIIYSDCGIHHKLVKCSPLKNEVIPCELAPERVTHCHCGKSSIKELGIDRSSCMDPIPECEKVCGKLLECGCTCMMKCHEGDCHCYNILEAKCRCEHHTFLVPCSFIQSGYKPICTRKCPALLSCRRHTHNEVCCESEPIAMRRERERKKQIRKKTQTMTDDDIMNMEPAHICTKPCNRLLGCKLHNCTSLCHYGPCSPCLESSSDDLVCPCGKTVIPAPVRCGTKIECSHECTRAKECGHRPEYHKCHEDDIACPKCTKPVSRQCDCGLRVIPNVLCSQESVSCGVPCAEPKVCSHPCGRMCSKDCQHGDHSTICNSLCKKIRTSCPHYCKQRCHFFQESITCDTYACDEAVTLFCPCRRMVKQVKCGASESHESVIGTVLECDEECARVSRNKKFMDALDTKEDTQLASVNPYPESLLNTFEKQRTWCSKVERTLRDFCGNQSKSFHFPSMRKTQRYFIHQLAEVYGLFSESQDSEPYRSVFIVLQASSKIPDLSLDDALKMTRQVQENRRLQAQIEIEGKARFNAIYIDDVGFGITKDDLEVALEPILNKSRLESPRFRKIKEDTYVLYPANFHLVSQNVENQLYLLSKSFKGTLSIKSLAFTCILCKIDDDAQFVLELDLDSSKSKFVPGPVAATSSSMTSQNSFEVLQEKPKSIEEDFDVHDELNKLRLDTAPVETGTIIDP